MIKCEIWNIKICEGGAIGMVHGNYSYIKEFYIPKYKISFNVFDDTVNIFETHDGRYTNEDSKKLDCIEMPNKLAQSMKKYLDDKDSVSKNVKNFLKRGLKHIIER